MKYFILVLFLGAVSLSAQSSYHENSDAAAVKLLKSLKQDYENHKSHRIEFELEIELPGQGTEVQKGTLIQAGDKYVLDLRDQKIVSDEETVWVYLKDMNEIQINDAEFSEDDEFMNPAAVFKMSDTDEFIFSPVSDVTEENIKLRQIEAKPVDTDSEYSKFRISLNSADNSFNNMKIFSKDGSRYTLKLIKHQKGYKVDAQTFIMDPDDYDGVYVEDLRF